MPMRAAAPRKRERKGQTANAVLCARAPCTGRPVPRPRRGGAVSVRAVRHQVSRKTQLARQNHIPMRFRKSDGDAPVMIFDNKLTQWSEATLQYM